MLSVSEQFLTAFCCGIEVLAKSRTYGMHTVTQTMVFMACVILEVMEAMNMKRHGPELGAFLNEATEWQFMNPGGTSEQCLEYITIKHKKTAS